MSSICVCQRFWPVRWSSANNRPALSPKNTLPLLTVGPSELYAYRVAGGSVNSHFALPVRLSRA